MHTQFQLNTQKYGYVCRFDIIMDPAETMSETVDCFSLAQDTVQWRTFVNTVINHRVP